MKKIVRIILLLFMLLVCGNGICSARTLTVGVYNFKPMIFIDVDGKPRGLFIDILEDTARREGWELKYVTGSWSDVYGRLLRHEIDLLPSVGYTEERLPHVDYNREPLFLDWGIIYRGKNRGITTLLDLRNTTVATLKGSIYTRELQKLLFQFDISCRFIEKNEYRDVLAAVESGEADAGACTNLYGTILEQDFRVTKTSIIFAPVKLMFAVPKGGNKQLLDRIDDHLVVLKTTPGSLYFTSTEKWLGHLSEKPLPAWVRRSALIGGTLLAALLLFIITLRRQVGRKTSQLVTLNRSLQESERRFRIMFETAPVGICLTDTEGRFIRVNRNHCDFFGRTEEELKRMTFRDVTHPDDLEGAHLLQDRLLFGGESSVSVEKRYIRKDGTILWGQLILSLFPGESETETLFLALVEDITPRKNAERQLQQQHALMEAILASVDAEIISVDCDMRYTAFNRLHAEAMRRMYGAEIAVGMKLPDAMTVPHEREAATENLRQALQGERVALEVVSGDPNHDIRALEISNNPIVDADGSIIGVAIFARDVTERRWAVEALQASERKFRNLLESVNMIAITIDAEGKITFCNDFLVNLIGWSREELIGRNGFEMLVAPEERERDLTQFRELLETGSHHLNHEATLVTRDGGKRTIVWDITVLRNAAGKVEGTASLGIDVTEQRILEEQLRHAQKMEAVGLLAGGIAHDFNNLLTIIIGNCQLMKRRAPHDMPLRHLLDRIEHASERATGLVQNLLAFSRKQVLNRQTVDVNDAIHRVEKLICRLVREDVTVKVTVAQEPLPVLADPGMLEQVLLNLVTNAVDAMPDGGRLTIATSATTSVPGALDVAKRYAVISVSDTGHGMDETTRDRIFDPFFTTKEVGKGTGLGLAMVFGTVREHDGFVHVDSAPGSGSTFRVSLPLIATAAGTGTKAAQTAPCGGSETILLVEDNEEVREITRVILQDAGYRVVEATDGLEGLETFRSSPRLYDIVILDVIMPRMSGAELFTHMRRLRPDVKALFMSGYAGDTVNRKGIVPEDRNFLPKPPAPDELLRRVRELLDLRR